MITNKLEKEVTLYKNQFEQFVLDIFKEHKLERLSIDLDGLLFRMKYMAKHNKDLDKLPGLKSEFVDKALQLRGVFGEVMYNFLVQIVGFGDSFSKDDIIDIMAQDVKIDTVNVKFKMMLISDNEEYLKFVDESIDESKPFNMFPNEFFRYYIDSYNDGIAKAYPELFQNRQQDKIGVGNDADVFCHSFTFQTSENCSLNCIYCLIGGTKILMADFTDKNIEDIKVGDVVYAFEEHPNDNRPRALIPSEVTKVFKRKVKKLYKLSSNLADFLYITGEHPILTTNGWKKTEDLVEGDVMLIVNYPRHLYTPEERKRAIGIANEPLFKEIPLRVECIEFEDEVDVYNFETKEHTYVANQVLVHNCYQFNKSKMRMDFSTAKKFIDSLLADKYGYINRYNSPAIILEFIGGEPLMEINLTRKIYEYFLEQTYEMDHPWFKLHRLSICSNGLQYFDEEVQDFFKEYASNISFNISIDGNKELHDACRIQPNGEGSYDVDIMALNHYNRNYTPERNSKMTLAPENMKYLFESVVNFINNGMMTINLNCVFEEGWNQKTALLEYNELKKVADYILEKDLENLYIAIFNEKQEDMSLKSNDGNFCGGLGSMLSLRPNGQFYPCIRYMPTSVGDHVQDLCIGNVDTGIVGREQNSEVLAMMDNITRRSQSNDICYDCPISNDCAWCFKAGTLIETINGPIPIEQLKIGDLVLSQDGKYNKVYQNLFRTACTKETMVIRAVGTPNIYTTKEHPFWAKKFIGHGSVKHNKNQRLYSDPQWIKAGDLSPKDKVYMLNKNFGNKEVDFYIAYLAGRWLGDGWRSDRRSHNGKIYPQFHLCCSYDEVDEVEELFKLANVEYTKDHTHRTAQEYLIRSKPLDKNSNNIQLIEILKQCGKYAHGKKVSRDMFTWNANSLAALFQGYISADGSNEKREYLTRFSTVSKQLAYDMSTICRMFGKNPSWTEGYNSNKIEGRTVSTKMFYDVRMYTSDNKNFKTDFDYEDDAVWSSITVAKSIGATYNVYNLSVEDDPTFYADGVLVHNCSALGHAVYGTPGKKPSFICIQMIAEALANVYYWNLLNIKKPQYKLGVRKNNVADEWALLVIDRDELDYLKKIESYSMIITMENQ